MVTELGGVLARPRGHSQGGNIAVLAVVTF